MCILTSCIFKQNAEVTFWPKIRLVLAINEVKIGQFWPILWLNLVNIRPFYWQDWPAEVSLFGENTAKRADSGQSVINWSKSAKLAEFSRFTRKHGSGTGLLMASLPRKCH